MLPVKIAVLSDFHIGRGARAKDLCPHSDIELVDTDYKSVFLKFLRSEHLKADYLILPGDMCHEGQPDEVDLASQLIWDTANALGIPPKKIVFVPGNHDIDWTAISAYPCDRSGFRRGQRYAPLRNNEWIFAQIMNNGSGQLLTPPHYIVWEFDNIVVVGYNSAWHDEPGDAVHHGLVDQQALLELEKYLNGIDLSPSRLRLFTVHHHPLLYSDPIPNEPDFSAMTNAENLLDLLRAKEFDLLVHGHKHKPCFKTQIIHSGFPLAILCSGSFSAKLVLTCINH